MALTKKQRAEVVSIARAGLKSVLQDYALSLFTTKKQLESECGAGFNKKDVNTLINKWRRSFKKWLETVK